MYTLLPLDGAGVLYEYGDGVYGYDDGCGVAADVPFGWLHDVVNPLLHRSASMYCVRA